MQRVHSFKTGNVENGLKMDYRTNQCHPEPLHDWIKKFHVSFLNPFKQIIASREPAPLLDSGPEK